MSLLNKIKPKFWDHHDTASGSHTRLFNFRRKWKLIVLLSSIVTLTPLIIMAFIDYRLTRKTMEDQLVLHTSRLVSNTWRSVSIFLAERKSALRFVLQDNTFEQLGDPLRMAAILDNLQKGIGGFVDIGVVQATGVLKAYAGPYALQGYNLCNEACFLQVVKQGSFISNLDTKGHHHQQLVMAIKHPLPGDDFFVLRASLDAESLYRMLEELEIGVKDDAFLINCKGILQTPSRHHGKVFDKIDLPIPPSAAKTRVIETKTPQGEPVILGYAPVPGTSFILMILRQKEEVMQQWWKPRIKLVGFLVLSLVAVFFAILGMATFLVHRIHAADQRRVTELHRVEYVNKLASIERLAAGMAHEINNPLAIINEKAGLIQDLLKMQDTGGENGRMLGLLESINASVNRCGTITQRLLNFARHIDVAMQSVDLGEVIQGMVDFVSREAQNQDIDIRVRIPEELPAIESDPSHLQQIFLNIFSNSFAAMCDGGGRLEITVEHEVPEGLTTVIKDNGCGIAEEDLKRVFEPFFTTKSQNGGTGLGLSITHGLVQKIGGRIDVQSRVGEGTRFAVFLPLRVEGTEPKGAVHDL